MAVPLPLSYFVVLRIQLRIIHASIFTEAGEKYNYSDQSYFKSIISKP